MDITELILDDHREQRRLFAILEQIDRADTGVLSAIWDRLASFLELHAAAEEAIFYPVLLQVGLAAHRAAGVEGETLDAIKDHNEIRDAVAEVARHQVVPTSGSARSQGRTWPTATTWPRRNARD